MKKIFSIFSTALIALSMAFVSFQPALAQAATVNVKASVTAKASTNTIDRGDKEITARIDSLTQLSTRIGQMMRVTDAQKSSINSEVQTLIANLTNLKAKIDADGTVTTGSSTLKADVQSITQTYRVYALVLPQISILAAIDRLGTITNSLNTVGAKIQARITQAQAAGKDVSTLQTTLTDYAAKIADAGTQGQAALNLILPLVPDNGDATVAASNKTALTTARADIKTATTDVLAARKDAGAMAKTLASFKLGGTTTVSASTTVSTSVQ